jgi:hypothetical protein
MTVGKGKRPRDPKSTRRMDCRRVHRPDSSARSRAAQGHRKHGARHNLRVHVGDWAQGRSDRVKRRLKTMTKAQRSKIAAKAAKARWKRAKS